MAIRSVTIGSLITDVASGFSVAGNSSQADNRVFAAGLDRLTSSKWNSTGISRPDFKLAGERRGRADSEAVMGILSRSLRPRLVGLVTCLPKQAKMPALRSARSMPRIFYR
jgi:hypothetical protein